MVFNTKVEAVKSLIDQTGLQSVNLKPQIPIKEEIQPCIEINKFSYIIASTSYSNSTGGTIYTTPADKDFYITAAALAVIKDATATSTTEALFAYIGGAAINILTIPSLTLTAQTLANNISFAYPLKIDRNTAITASATTAVGNIRYNAMITGFTL